MSLAPGPGTAGLRRAARVRTVLVRSASAVLVLLLTGGMVALADLVPPPVTVAAPAEPVAVPAAASRLVCPGPLRLPTEPEPGGDVAYDPQFDPAPAESVTTLRTVVTGAGPAVVDGLGDPQPGTAAGEPLVEVVPEQGAGVAAVDVDRPVVVRAEPGTDEELPWTAAVVGTTTVQGDLRGTVAVSCQRPASELWLVGGSTALGSSARLVLQNPGRTSASVTVRLWGPAGPVELAGAPEFLVPPGQERAVLLEGVAAEQRRLAVHLTAAGGLITAYLQDSALRGLVPAGVDHVVAGEPPSPRQVVTGLQVPATEVAGADTALLRLLAPEAATTARVRLLGPAGAPVLPATEVPLDAGTVLDLPLGGVPAGSWTAVVEADEPVVAGALVTRGAGVGLPEGLGSAVPLERAWAPSVPTGVEGPLALPDMPGVLLVAAVPGDDPGGSSGRVGDGPAAATLQVMAADGRWSERRLEVQAGTTLELPLQELLAPGPDAPVGGGVPAGLALRSDDERIVWGAVLSTPQEDGALVSVVVPVRPEVPVRDLRVRTR